MVKSKSPTAKRRELQLLNTPTPVISWRRGVQKNAATGGTGPCALYMVQTILAPFILLKFKGRRKAARYVGRRPPKIGGRRDQLSAPFSSTPVDFPPAHSSLQS